MVTSQLPQAAKRRAVHLLPLTRYHALYPPFARLRVSSRLPPVRNRPHQARSHRSPPRAPRHRECLPPNLRVPCATGLLCFTFSTAANPPRRPPPTDRLTSIVTASPQIRRRHAKPTRTPRLSPVQRGIVQRKWRLRNVRRPSSSSPHGDLPSPVVHERRQKRYPLFHLCTNGVYPGVLWLLLDRGPLSHLLLLPHNLPHRFPCTEHHPVQTPPVFLPHPGLHMSPLLGLGPRHLVIFLALPHTSDRFRASPVPHRSCNAPCPPPNLPSLHAPQVAL